MLKLLTHIGSTPTLVLGLEHTNLDRLRDTENDWPILVRMSDVGLGDAQIVIVGGRDQGVIIDKLQAAGMVSQSSADLMRSQLTDPRGQ